MTLLAYFLSFFLEKDFGSYFRALCQNNADIRFPRGLPNNRGLVGRFMFKWLKHKLTHKHLEDIAGTVFARYNKTKMVLLLIERNEENILNAHPELLRNTDLSQIPIILDRASRSATDDTAPIVLNVFFIMLDDIKRRMSPNPVATALFNHSLTHGAGLLFWAIDAQLVSDTILNEKLHQKENHVN